MNQIGPGISVNGSDVERRQPAAQEQDGGDPAHQDHVGVLAEEEQRERHRAVFDVVAGDQRRLVLGQVERVPVGLGQDRGDEDHEHREVRDEEPDVPLRAHDVRQIERAGRDQDAEDDQADRDLVAHHLRRAAQSAQEGIARVAGPAGHDHAVDAERADREQVEDADIDVGEHQAVAERDHRPADQGQDEGDHRRQQEHDLVGAGRDDGLLDEQLEAVGQRLQQAVGPDRHRPLAQLHGADHLALGIGDIGHGQQQRHDDQQDLQRP